MAAAPDEDDAGDDAAMRARLRSLTDSLEGHRQASASPEPTNGPSAPGGMGQAMSIGFRVMSEFVAAVVVGAGIGWAIDRWLHSTPAALILFIGLGTAAGFVNVYRISTRPTGGRAGGL